MSSSGPRGLGQGLGGIVAAKAGAWDYHVFKVDPGP